MGDKNAILKTLLYSDIFDYPLTKEEIWKFLIFKKIDKNTFERLLKQLITDKKINLNKGFYHMPDRAEIIRLRLQREKIGEIKIKKAKEVADIFRFIPFIRFIGISGSVALKNCKESEDIDFFVVSENGRLWLTRFIMVVLLKLLGKYRNYGEKKVSDKVCLNMLVTEGTLSLPKGKQNLYTAREVLQLLPVLDKKNTYKNFLNANIWVRSFFPNSIVGMKKEILINKDNKNYFLLMLNFFLKSVQLKIIKKHQTMEIVLNNFLAFHPLDYKNRVIFSYRERLKKYGII